MGVKDETQADNRTRWRGFGVIGYWVLGIGLGLCALYARPQPPDGGGACTPPATSEPQARLASNLFVWGGQKKQTKADKAKRSARGGAGASSDHSD